MIVLVAQFHSLPDLTAQEDRKQSELLYKRGVAELENGQVQQGIATLASAISANPGNGEAWEIWAYAHHETSKFDEAIAGFMVGATIDSVRQNSLYNLACAYSLKSEKEKSLDYLRQAFAAGFDDFDVLADDSDFENVRNDPAFKKLVRAAQDPKGFSVHPRTQMLDRARQFSDAANILSLSGFHIQAGEAAVTSLRLDELDGTAYIVAGYSFQMLGRKQRAKSLYEDALEFPSAKPTALYNLACLAAIDNQPDQAMDLLGQSLNAGFDSYDHIESDTDLNGIRKLPQFNQMIANAKAGSNALNGIEFVTAKNDSELMSGKNVVGRVSAGRRMLVHKTNGNWLQVNVPGKNSRAWIKNSNVSRGMATNSIASNTKRRENPVRRTPPTTTNRNSAASNTLETTNGPSAFVRNLNFSTNANAPFTAEEQAELTRLSMHITTLQQQGKIAQAAKDFQHVIDKLDARLSQLNEYPALLQMLGSMYSALEDVVRARKMFERAAGLQAKNFGKDNDLYIGLLDALAKSNAFLLNFPKAERLYQETLQRQANVYGKDSAQYGFSLVNFGSYQGIRGQLEKGENLITEGIRLMEKHLSADDMFLAQALIQKAYFYFQSGDMAESESVLNDVMKTHQAKGENDYTYLNARYTLATFYLTFNKIAQAQPLLEDLLEKRENNQGIASNEYIQTLMSLGMLHQGMTEFAKAESLFVKARDIAENTFGTDSNVYSMSLALLGNLSLAQGNLVEAEQFTAEALQVRELHLGENHPFTADTLLSLASIYGEMGATQKVEPMFKRALKIQENIYGKDSFYAAQTLNSLGAFYLDQDQPNRAEPFVKQASERFRSAFGPDSFQYATTLQNQANIHSKRNEFDQAQQLFEQALEILKNHQQHFFAQTLANFAELQTKKKDFSRAEENYRKASRLLKRTLGYEHPTHAESLRMSGVLYHQMKQPEKATQVIQDYRISVRQHTGKILPGLGPDLQIAYLQNEFGPGLASSLSFAFDQRQNDRVRILSAGWLLNGKGLAQEVMAEGSLLTTSEAAPLVKELRAVRNQLSRITFQLEPDESKRRQQVEQIADLESRQQALVKQISRFSRGGSQDDLWVSIGQLRESIPLNAVMINFAKFDVNQIKRELNPDKHRPDERYVAWVIPSVGQAEIQVIDLGEAKQIDESVRELRKAIADSANEIYENGEKIALAKLSEEIESLSRLVIHPLEPFVSVAEEIILSPDSLLWLVPWSCLPNKNEQLLIEKYNLRYVLSGREMVKRKTDRALISEPVIFADPDYDLGSKPDPEPESNPNGQRGVTSQKFSRLFGTADEAKSVAPVLENYSRKKVRVFTRKSALESTLKNLHRPQALVISTHGFFEADQEVAESQKRKTEPGDTRASPVMTKNGMKFENPLLRCGLALAGSNNRGSQSGEDGILTGMEIVGCDFRGTEIVVLSACETGLGDVSNGEGVAGLRQAFQLAGAEAVIASLWKVPDTETKNLMTLFWKNMAEGQSKSESLRNAQLEIIRQHRKDENASHPYFWAAFTLTGQ